MPPEAMFHAVSALAAVALGAWQLAAAKRGARHRGVGYLWFAAMAATALSSFLLHGPRGFDALGGYGWIHGLSLWTLFALAMALRAAVGRRIAAHRRWVVGAYTGLVIAGCFAFALPGRAMHELFFVTLPPLVLKGV